MDIVGVFYAIFIVRRARRPHLAWFGVRLVCAMGCSGSHVSFLARSRSLMHKCQSVRGEHLRHSCWASAESWGQANILLRSSRYEVDGYLRRLSVALAALWSFLVLLDQ